MTVNLRLKGEASLVHVQTPSGNLARDEYFARIELNNGSILGEERPLQYDVPLTRGQYEGLQAQMKARDFRDPIGEAERYDVPPHIAVKCELEIIVVKGKV